MANANLSAAKKAEFYTQYADIAREMEAYGYSAGGGGAGRPALPNTQMNGSGNVTPVGRDIPVAPCGGRAAAGFAPNVKPVGRDIPVAPHCKGCAASISPPAVHLIDSAKHYHSIGRWFLHLILIMPDHLHMIITPSAVDGLDGTDRDVLVAPLQNTIIRWKAYVSRMFGIRFQRDFWDTRIRDAVHFTERCEYVQRNPVRKGLVSEAESWPWKWDCRNEMDVKCDEVG